MKPERVRKAYTRPHPVAVSTLGLAALGVQQGVSALGVDFMPIDTIGAAGAAAFLGGAVVLGHRAHPRGRIRAQYGQGGWLSARELRRSLGRAATREQALTVRPSLEQLTRAERLRLPDSAFGACIGRTVTGPAVSRRLHFAYRDVALVVAPPQSGKTALLGNWIIDHPGPVVSTSTKTDAHLYTHRARAKVGEVLVFNPEALADLDSTFRWSPIDGCDDSRIAQERASHLVAGASEDSRDGRIWEDASAAVLRAYLMAAALEDKTMADVTRWVADPTDRAALKILQRYPLAVPEAWVDGLQQMQSDATPERTRGSVYFTLRQAVAFMGDPTVAQICLPRGDERTFDVAEFIDNHATLYLIGSERKHATIAPLLAALTGHIFESAKRMAARKPKGRHDPPVLFALDEAALIVPVPLDRWTSDAGGRGITLAIAVQSPSQLVARWGQHGAATIRNNSNVKIYFGGLTEPPDLEAVSVVCGEREEDSVTDSLDGGERTPKSVTRRTARTITPDRVRSLPRWHVLVMYRTSKPVIARVTPVWDRRDVRAA